MNRQKAVTGLRRIHTFLMKFDFLMSPTIYVSIEALNTVIEWLQNVEIDHNE